MGNITKLDRGTLKKVDRESRSKLKTVRSPIALNSTYTYSPDPASDSNYIV